MMIDIICCFFITIIFLFPITSNIITDIHFKHSLKKILGITLVSTEILMLFIFFCDISRMPSTNIWIFIFILFLGGIVSILFTFIRNFRNRKALLKLIYDFQFKIEDILNEIVRGIVSCSIEEIIWRGIIQERSFIQHQLLAIAFTSIAFTVSHIKRRVLLIDMLEIFILSCILGYIMMITKNLLYCIIFHWARNCVIIIIKYSVYYANLNQ